MPTQIEIQQDITNRIIESLQQCTIPCRKPWKEDPNCGAAANVVSKKTYSGINPLLLDLTAMSRGFQSRWWGTFDQWSSMGGQVRKRPSEVRSGDWGTRIVFYRRIERKRIQNGEETSEVFPLLKTYAVFNLDQVDGESLNHLRANNESPNVVPNFEAAQEAIESTKADIRYGSNSAFYIRPSGAFPNHIGGDYICMPNMQQFFKSADFYSTAFHELVHWSECRLGWKGSYAMGELIAEIGSFFLSSQIGIPCSDDLQNHTAYLASWLKDMQEDPRAILRASSQASKAAEFILSFSRQETPEVLEVEVMDQRKVHQHIDRNMARILQFENELGALFVLPKNWHYPVYRWLAMYFPEALMGDAENLTAEVVFDVCIRLDFREKRPL